MTKAEAVYAFFSSFGVAAYVSGAVPDDATFPRLTYDLVTGDYGREAFFPGSLWYRTDSLAAISDKTDEIAKKITLGGIILPCDRGHIHLYCGTPWAQMTGDPTDDKIKRNLLNFRARFNTLP